MWKPRRRFRIPRQGPVDDPVKRNFGLIRAYSGKPSKEVDGPEKQSKSSTLNSDCVFSNR